MTRTASRVYFSPPRPACLSETWRDSVIAGGVVVSDVRLVSWGEGR